MDHEISGGMVRDHSDRLRGVERELADLRSKVSSMGTELETVKEGVANFRAFQRENREFMGWFKGNEEQREKREREEKEEARRENDRKAKLHYWWLGILSALIVASVIWTTSWVHDFMTSHHISANTTSITETMPTDARK